MARVKLKNYIREYTERNKNSECTDVYSVTNSSGFINSTDYFSKEVFSKNLSNYKLVYKNSLAFNPSRINIGSVAVQNVKDKVIVSPLYTVFRVDEDRLLPEYLNYFLHSNLGLQQINNSTAGSVRDVLKYSALENMTLNIPSLDVQKKCIETLKTVKRVIDEYIDYLNDLDLLVKSRFIEMFGDSKDNPKEFKLARIGEFTEVLTGATPNRSNEDYYEGNIPWVKTGEIHPGYINSTEECITEVALQETNCKLLPIDTVMVAMYGQGKTRGKSGILGIKAATNQACAAILPCERLNPIFLNQYLVLEYNRLRDMGRGAQQANLNLSMIKNYPILSVPIDLQNQFADFVAQVDKAKLAVQQSLNELETLKKSLMQQYFG